MRNNPRVPGKCRRPGFRFAKHGAKLHHSLVMQAGVLFIEQIIGCSLKYFFTLIAVYGFSNAKISRKHAVYITINHGLASFAANEDIAAAVYSPIPFNLISSPYLSGIYRHHKAPVQALLF